MPDFQTPPFLDPTTIQPADAAENSAAGTIAAPGDNSVSFANLMAQMRGQQEASQPRKDPLQDFIDKHATKGFGSYLQDQLGNTQEDQDARKTAGKSERLHDIGNIGKILFGGIGGLPYNPVVNAKREMTSDQGNVKTAVNELRNQQLAQAAQAKVEEAGALRESNEKLKSQANLTKQQDADTRKAQAEALATLRQGQLELANKLGEGKISVEEADAAHKKLQDKFLEAHQGLTGQDATLAAMASNGSPEALKLAYAQREAMKSLGKVVGTGSLGSSITTPGPDGNPVTSNSRQRTFASPGAAMLAQMGLPALAGQQSTSPSPINAPQALGMPNAPVRPQGTPQAPVAPPTPQSQYEPFAHMEGVPPDWEAKNFKFASTGSAKTDVKDLANAQAKAALLKPGIEEMRQQRANLADAMINGDAPKYTGLMNANNTVSKLRAMAGTVSPNEALGKPLDFGALFGNLQGMKGAFKNSEIQRAVTSMGQNVEDPVNQLMTHAANELTREAAHGTATNQFNNMHVTPEETTKAAKAELERYMQAVGTAASMPGTVKTNPAKAAYVSAHQSDLSLHTIQQAIADSRSTGKLKSAGVTKDKPSSINDVSVDDLLKMYHAK